MANQYSKFKNSFENYIDSYQQKNHYISASEHANNIKEIVLNRRKGERWAKTFEKVANYLSKNDLNSEEIVFTQNLLSKFRREYSPLKKRVSESYREKLDSIVSSVESMNLGMFGDKNVSEIPYINSNTSSAVGTNYPMREDRDGNREGLYSSLKKKFIEGISGIALMGMVFLGTPGDISKDLQSATAASQNTQIVESVKRDVRASPAEDKKINYEVKNETSNPEIKKEIKKIKYDSNSVVDSLKKKGLPSDFEYRKKFWDGLTQSCNPQSSAYDWEYVGSEKQNIILNYAAKTKTKEKIESLVKEGCIYTPTKSSEVKSVEEQKLVAKDSKKKVKEREQKLLAEERLEAEKLKKEQSAEVQETQEYVKPVIDKKEVEKIVPEKRVEKSACQYVEVTIDKPFKKPYSANLSEKIAEKGYFDVPTLYSTIEFGFEDEAPEAIKSKEINISYIRKSKEDESRELEERIAIIPSQKCSPADEEGFGGDCQPDFSRWVVVGKNSSSEYLEHETEDIKDKKLLTGNIYWSEKDGFFKKLWKAVRWWFGFIPSAESPVKARISIENEVCGDISIHSSTLEKIVHLGITGAVIGTVAESGGGKGKSIEKIVNGGLKGGQGPGGPEF